MRYENLRWLLVIAGIGLLVIFHKSNSNPNEQKWQDDAPQIDNAQASLADSLVQDVANQTGSNLQRLELPSVDVPTSHTDLLADAAPLPTATLSLTRSLPTPDLGASDFVELEAPEFSEASNQSFDGTDGEVAPTSMSPDYPLSSDDFSADLDVVEPEMAPMIEEDRATSSLENSGHLVRNPFDDAEPNQAPPVPVTNQLPPAMNASTVMTPTAEPMVDNMPPMVERSAFPTKHNVPQAVEVRAVHHVEYGKSLARRGALYAARQEFYGALRIIAQSIDIQTGTQEYSRGLASAFIAMKEADDFYRQQVDVEHMPNIQRICSTHETEVLNESELMRLSPAQAMQAYYAYAQQLMVRSGGNSVVASEALYCLGRLYTAKSKVDASGRTLDKARAIVHHQASLEIDPQNFRSANEVGVLLSQTGQLGRAADMLQRSLRVHQTAKVWNNLAQVHQRMAATANPQVQMEQSQLAQMARVEYQRMLQQPSSAMATTVQWVEPAVFSKMGGERIPERTASSANQPVVEPPAEENKSIMGRIKSWF